MSGRDGRGASVIVRRLELRESWASDIEAKPGRTLTNRTRKGQRVALYSQCRRCRRDRGARNGQLIERLAGDSQCAISKAER